MKKLSLLLVDDHPIVSEGLELFLSQDSDLQILGTAASAKKGLKLLRQLHPDVVVLDLSMPDMNGLEAIELFLSVRPKSKVLIYSSHTEEKFVYQAFRAGALGYVLKGSSLAELKQAILFIQDGGYWVSAQFSRCVIDSYLKSRNAEVPELSALEQLSDREKQVLRLLAKGRSTDEISELLYISQSTVAKHRLSLMNKTGLNNIAEIVRFAIRNGIIEP